MNRKLSQRGLTLVEAMFAIFIAAVVLSGVLRVALSGAQLVYGAKHKARALAMAEARMEVLRAETYDDLAAGNLDGDEAVVIDGYDTANAVDDLAGVRSTNTEPADGGVKIAVAVTWNEGVQNFRETFLEARYP